jgi:hypothetical protein
MAGLSDVREHGQIGWSERELGWIGAPETIVLALTSDG